MLIKDALIYKYLLTCKPKLIIIILYKINIDINATLHEYPESNYVTVDIYTCGKEGDPKTAIMNFINNLDVKKYKFNFLNRGEF